MGRANRPTAQTRLERVNASERPMFGRRPATPELDLRHLTEADLATPAAILPADAGRIRP
jgi:hypothetical protein